LRKGSAAIFFARGLVAGAAAGSFLVLDIDLSLRAPPATHGKTVNTVHIEQRVRELPLD
jgi:hypothetical protein